MGRRMIAAVVGSNALAVALPISALFNANVFGLTAYVAAYWLIVSVTSLAVKAEQIRPGADKSARRIYLLLLLGTMTLASVGLATYCLFNRVLSSAP